ncbi:MAG: DUF2520 domain-containing protein [Balneolales bacterium]
MSFNHQVSIIGTGAVGGSLIRTLHKKGTFVSGLYNRTKSVADELADEVDAEKTGVFPDSLEYLGELCFICVPDDQIPEVALKLSELKGIFRKVSFVHTSGAKPASVLKPLQEKGSEIASFHPLQTFGNPDLKNAFKGIYISLQGDKNLLKILQDVTELLKAKYLVVNEKQKASLHLAAVFACNYLVALMEAARQSLNLDEPDIDVTEVMQPLITSTWNNIRAKGVDESLTGPISRGDAGTIQEHLSILKKSPKLTNLYAHLGSVALEIGGRNGLDNEKIQNIQKILEKAKQ